MKYIQHFLVVLCWLTTIAAMAQHTKNKSSIPFRFATRAEAQMLITNIDQFTTNWNQFDVDVRLQKNDGKKSQLLTVAMNATRNWSEEEKSKVSKAMKSLENSLKNLKSVIPFNQEVILVKTSMVEEGGVSAYTRENWIAIGEETLSQTDEQNLQYLLAHELFHILTRSNASFKKSSYAIIGFTTTSQEIRFPMDLIQKRISNPDISRQDSYASFNIDGKTQNCIMVLYTDKTYSGGGLTDYIKVGLVPLNEQLIPLQENGETIIYPVEKATDFYEKVGKNTEYVLHPEEILADNFAYTLTGKKNLPTPTIIENIKNVLKGKQ